MRWAFLSYRSWAHLFARQFEEAAHRAGEAARIPRCHFSAFAHRVAALGHLDRPQELPQAVGALMHVAPTFSQAEARRRLFFVKLPEQMKVYIEGLRKAGIS